MSNNDSSQANNTANSSEIPAWLTANIFTEILQKNVQNYEKIINFNAKRALEAGENFMTLLLSITIEIALKDGTKQELAYMVKILPNIENMQEMLKTWRVFEKELLIYTKYIPAFEALYKNADKAIQFGAELFTTHETTTPKELIIMEDLRVRGFKNIKRQQGLDMAHTKCALEKLAEFHAASACYFEKHGAFPEMYNKSLCSKEDLFVDYRKNTADLIREYLPLYNATYLNEKLAIYTSQVPDQFQAQSLINEHEFNVLNHGDCWANNIMFRYNSDGTISETYFIDFQMSRYGSPAHDLSYLLISSTSLENKIKYFDYFVAYYHEKLIEKLKILKYSKQLPTLRDLHVALLKTDWAYTIIANVMPVCLLDPTEKANKDNIIDDGKNGNELKRLMFTSSRYIAHMKQLLPWLDNRGLFEYRAL